MVKQLLKLMLCSATLLIPVGGYAANTGVMESEGISEVVQSVKVTVRGRSVRVQYAKGATLEVYSVTGAKVTSVKIDSADQIVSLKLIRGCYIVKVGNIARKISIL